MKSPEVIGVYVQQPGGVGGAVRSSGQALK